jgi:hypothetical protein
MGNALRSMLYGAVLTATAVPAANAGAILTVGAGGGADYTTLSAAVRFASAHTEAYYTIEVAPGVYLNDFSVVTAPMTIKAAPGGPVVFNATAPPPNGKAIITTSAAATIIGLTFENAAVSPAQGSNGAAIRAQAGTSRLIIENSIFKNNQDGILADADPTGNISISGSSFIGNGFDAGGGTCPAGGCDHAVYIGAINSLLITGSLFCGTHVGHDIKSRAATTTITDNRLYDGAANAALGCPAGSTSYAVDLANGGAAVISGNQIIQGAGTQNATMISYGAEGLVYSDNTLSVSNNTFISADVADAIGINNPRCIPARLQGNVFQGVGAPINPPNCGVYLDHSVAEPNNATLLLSVFILYSAIYTINRTKNKQNFPIVPGKF